MLDPDFEARLAPFASKRLTPAEAIGKIKRGKHIFIGSGAAEPVLLVEELVRQADRMEDNTIVHLLTLGPAPYVEPKYQSAFRHNAFFIGANVRKAVHEGRADYTPVFLSQIPGLIRSGRMRVDVALIETSPPDRFGFVNLGVSVDVVLSAIETAKIVIAEINPNMPVIYGSGFVPMAKIDGFVVSDRPLLVHEPEALDDVDREIGKNVAALVEDGSTLQMGIGRIPDATLEALKSKSELGVWTEMFSDGVIDLIQNGNITGKNKTIHPRKISCSFTFGSRRLYDFVHQNPMFSFHPSDYINNPIRVAEQYKMVAINSALQIDLTGQVCADSIGTKFYSGIGGQVDFIRGASMCPGGKPIIAIRSTAMEGKLSRIVATLDPGAGVVTSRGDVRFVVTEWGVADLWGKSVRERASALIGIAHPDFRGELLAEAKKRHYVFASDVAPAAYPGHLERSLETSRGPVWLRPMKVTDQQKLFDLFYSLPEDSSFHRWLRQVKQLSPDEMFTFLRIDYQKSMLFVLELRPAGQDSEMIGAARYDTDPSTGYAEVAFVVRDDWQGLGLGSELLQALVKNARKHGIPGFVAEVPTQQAAMLRVFHKFGLDISTTLADNVYRLTMDIPRRPAERANTRAPTLAPPPRED